METTAKIKLEDLYGKCLYQVQYTDYPKDVFTVPLSLLRNRAEKFLSDASVSKVRLIFPNGAMLELELI